MKLGSLFDGIGGFPLAASRCGIEPVWAWPMIPDGTELYCLDDKETVTIKGKDEIDMDIRFGCLAYGLKVEGAK